MVTPHLGVPSVSLFVCLILEFTVIFGFHWLTLGSRLSDVSRPVSFAGEAVARLIMGIPRRFRWVTFLVSKKALRQSRVWGKPSLLCFLLIRFCFLISYVAFSREHG